MTFLRHAPRQVHAAVVQRVTDGLDALGWTDADTVPFGGDPVKITSVAPFNGARLSQEIGPNMVTITLGDEAAPDPEELGGHLASQGYPVFVDVFMDTQAGAVALGSDIRDLFLGRFSGQGFMRYLPLVDKATGTPVDGWQLEMDDVERVAPEHNFPLVWQAVHMTVTATFDEVIP